MISVLCLANEERLGEKTLMKPHHFDLKLCARLNWTSLIAKSSAAFKIESNIRCHSILKTNIKYTGITAWDINCFLYNSMPVPSVTLRPNVPKFSQAGSLNGDWLSLTGLTIDANILNNFSVIIKMEFILTINNYRNHMDRCYGRRCCCVEIEGVLKKMVFYRSCPKCRGSKI